MLVVMLTSGNLKTPRKYSGLRSPTGRVGKDDIAIPEPASPVLDLGLDSKGHTANHGRDMRRVRKPVTHRA